MINTWVWPDTLIEVGVILAVMLIAWRGSRFLIKRIVGTAINRRDKMRAAFKGGSARLLGLNNPRQENRTRALGSLLSSIAAFVIITIGILMIMSTIGLPMGPLLASAGVGGVAIGFGAQSLVKDFLSGIFMIAEDQLGPRRS